LQGRLHNEKDKISWDLVKQMYLEPKYISPCHAGSLFGIISASGLIYPCEILEDKVLGNLRKNEMNFMNVKYNIFLYWLCRRKKQSLNFFRFKNWENMGIMFL